MHVVVKNNSCFSHVTFMLCLESLIKQDNIKDARYTIQYFCWIKIWLDMVKNKEENNLRQRIFNSLYLIRTNECAFFYNIFIAYFSYVFSFPFLFFYFYDQTLKIQTLSKGKYTGIKGDVTPFETRRPVGWWTSPENAQTVRCFFAHHPFTFMSDWPG